MINTVLVDDHKLFCDGMERLLNESGSFYTTKKYYNGRTLLEDLANIHLDLLLLDIEMPGLTGLDVIPRIRSANPDIKIVILSMHEENVYAKEAYLLGANAFLVKSIESSALIHFLTRVCNGEKIFPEMKNTITDNESPLSEREEEVLKLIAKGQTSEQIALKLKISPLTVKAHRRNMLRKIDASNSSELIRKALQMGLL